MKVLRLALAVALACLLGPRVPADGPEDQLRADVGSLAAESMQGRLTGGPGGSAAAAYLQERLQELGLEPLPRTEGLQLAFEFTAGVNDAGSSLKLFDEMGPGSSWQSGKDMRALPFSDSRRFAGPVVFAGYGITVPPGQTPPYDSYAGLEVENAIVMVLRYFPEDADEETRKGLSRYAGLRFKAMRARELGARGLLVVTGPRSPGAGELVKGGFDTALAGSGIAAASISGEMAAAMLKQYRGPGLEALQKELDSGNPHVAGRRLTGVDVELTTRVERQRHTATNVIGYLPATGDAPLAEPWVVIGAHYDHLGTGDLGNSLARGEEIGKVHRGADDNASGVAAVLSIAAALEDEERGRHLVVALWSGEELGLLGSADFVSSEIVDPSEISAYVNFDMVGRLRDNRLTLQAVGSSDVWPRWIEQLNVRAGFDIQAQDDPYLPTDTTSFQHHDIPTLNLFTGAHEDYHRPGDVPEKLDYEGLARIADLGTRLVRRLLNEVEAPEFVRVEPTSPAGADRDSVRAFTGTIPDYATEVEGLLLSGVVAGGPAEEAGLKGGDVIVRFGTQAIKNIYDYTYALDAVKVGEPVEVEYLRDGERHEAVVTPRLRD